MALSLYSNSRLSYVIPAFAPIDFSLASSSGDVANADFKIVCKIYYDPSGANTLISTQQINAIPPTNKSVFTCQDVIKSYITSTYSILSGNTTDLGVTELPSFRVGFQEYYNGALRGSVVYSATFFVWYASPTYRQYANNEWQLYNAAWYVSCDPMFYLLSGFKNVSTVINSFSGKDKWLKVKPTQKMQLNFPLKGGTFYFRYWLKTLDANFNQITLSKNDLGFLNTGEYCTFDVGRTEIGAHTWDVAPNFTNAKYYVIGIYNSNELEMASYTYLYELDTCTTGYTAYEVHWLNRWGGYDSFVFDGASKVTTNVDKTYAKYQPPKINDSGVLIYNTYNVNKKPYHVGLDETYVINSRLLEDFEVEGLQDLFTSPEVYWRTSDGFVSVTVNGSTFENFKSENGKVFSVQIEMNVNHTDERQW